MPDEDELEKIREQKRQELEQQGGESAEAQEARRQEAEAQKKSILRQSLEPEARERLNAIKMAKPERGEQVERQLVALAQSGRLQGKITEEQIKQILKEFQDDSSFDIKHSGL